MGNGSSKIISIGTRAVVSVALLAIGIAGFALLRSTHPEVPRRPVELQVQRVQAMEVTPVEVRRKWEGFGTAIARDEANVPAEISARVKSIPDELRPGSPVFKDQPLVFLDDADVRSRQRISLQAIARLNAQSKELDIDATRLKEQLSLSEDERAVANADYQRALESQRQGAATDSEVDAKRSRVKATARIESELRRQLELIEPKRAGVEASIAEEKARLEIVLNDLARCTIRCPLNGTLQTLDVNEGEQVTSGTRVARVVSLNRIEIPLRFPITARQSIRLGDPVELISEGAGRLIWQARIVRLAPESDRTTRTCIAYCELEQTENDDPLLVPGQFVRAIVTVSRAEAHLVVPRRAVLDDALWVINAQEQAERRAVDVLYHTAGSFSQLGPSDSDWVVLRDTSDLIPGDVVILSNIDSMRAGLSVQSSSATAGADRINQPESVPTGFSDRAQDSG